MRGISVAAAAAAALCLSFASAPAAAAAGAPAIGPAWTAGVGTAAAGLRGEVSPEGASTTYRFSYIAETAYQANLAAARSGFFGAASAPAGAPVAIGAGTVPVTVTVAQQASGLSRDSAYRFRLEATNSFGTALGPALLFYTEDFGGSLVLPDARAWEMVSPAEKGGGEVQGPGRSFGGGVIQAAAVGGGLTYSSTSSFGAAPGAPSASQYIARRTAAGWASENVSQPTFAGAYGSEPDGVPYQLFSPDLARALLSDGCEALPSCDLSYSLRDSASGALTRSALAPDLRFAGADPDLRYVVLSTCAALTADAVEAPGAPGCDPAEPNLYRWSAGALTLLNLLPAAAQGTPGASLAAQSGAVSADGNRVYWKLNGNLYLREGATTREVDASVGGGGTFEGAAVSGAVAFFSRAGHLYRYEAPAGTVTDLTPAGGLQGVLGAAADGSRVYYLTTGGLFMRAGGAPAVKVADAADASNYPAATGTARLTPNGGALAFVSSAPLTGYDNRGAPLAPVGVAGVPQPEVFLYDVVAGALTCASCNPTGERPLGPSAIPAANPNGAGPGALRAYKPRALAEGGRRLFFDSGDDLALADDGAHPDVYEWEAAGTGSCQRPGGCLGLVSAGRNGTGASLLDASSSGADVFFLTSDSLLGVDAGFADVYDAREGGGFPEAPRPLECVGDACQFLPSEPEDPSPTTLLNSGGNPPAKTTVLSARKCPKGKKLKRGRCVKAAHRRHRASSHGAKRGRR